METFVIHPDKDQGKALKAILKALKVPFEIKKDDELPADVIKSLKTSLAQAKKGELNPYKGIEDMLKRP